MKTDNEVISTDEPKDEGWDYEGSRRLSALEVAAIGLPLSRKAPKEARINIRLAGATLDGLKARAAEAGMPYQTLAASVLHLVATGKLRLELIGPTAKKRK